ncbi:hypothetical protein K438DRAFT_449991 [Mycena galopus ATCC 62051]|nr:hypothetical protein K438DRAFT_449991 [Mycena galopus ATCC 62051]
MALLAKTRKSGWGIEIESAGASRTAPSRSVRSADGESRRMRVRPCRGVGGSGCLRCRGESRLSTSATRRKCTRARGSEM